MATLVGQQIPDDQLVSVDIILRDGTANHLGSFMSKTTEGVEVIINSGIASTTTGYFTPEVLKEVVAESKQTVVEPAAVEPATPVLQPDPSAPAVNIQALG